jgi:hypothetical protein
VTESSEAVVWGVSGNHAVVQLPGRRFPALAIQGDSLHILCDELKETRDLLDAGDRDEALLALGQVSETLDAMRRGYEAILAERGLALPYFGS